MIFLQYSQLQACIKPFRLMFIFLFYWVYFSSSFYIFTFKKKKFFQEVIIRTIFITESSNKICLKAFLHGYRLTACDFRTAIDWQPATFARLSTDSLRFFEIFLVITQASKECGFNWYFKKNYSKIISKNKKSPPVGLFEIFSQTHWWKKMFFKSKTVIARIFKEYPISTRFRFIIRKRVIKTKKYKNCKQIQKHTCEYNFSTIRLIINKIDFMVDGSMPSLIIWLLKWIARLYSWAGVYQFEKLCCCSHVLQCKIAPWEVWELDFRSLVPF